MEILGRLCSSSIFRFIPGEIGIRMSAGEDISAHNQGIILRCAFYSNSLGNFGLW
jgi:hypothetical protein